MAVSLELVWTLVAQVRMQPLAVVEHRDVRDDVCSGLLAGLLASPVDPLGLQGAEEALDHRVVPTVSFATHATGNAVGLEQFAEGIAGIVHAAIAVEDQLPLWRLAEPQRHLQCITDQSTAQAPPQRPTDHFAREQVDDHRQVQPPFLGPEGQVMSPAHTRFGALGAKSRCRRLGYTALR